MAYFLFGVQVTVGYIYMWDITICIEVIVNISNPLFFNIYYIIYRVELGYSRNYPGYPDEYTSNPLSASCGQNLT